MEGFDGFFTQPDELALNTVVSDDTMEALRLRNEQKLKEAKERLGTKYLLAPENKAKRLTKFKPRKK